MAIGIRNTSVLFLTGVALTQSVSAPLYAEMEAEFTDRCEAMTGLSLDGVEITSSEFIPAGSVVPAGAQSAGAVLPAHCQIAGMINRRQGAGGETYGIGFELALPEQWNERYLLMGGGGLNGLIRPPIGPVAAGDRHALSRGFAVASHDSGHKGVVFDQSFMADQRAALDFAETSVLTVTLTTRDLVARFYGQEAGHSYMTGCSTGGREGMLASQRYPELFDGIAVGAPAMRPGFSNLTIEYAQVLLNRTLPDDDMRAASFAEWELSLISGELLKQCDARDGIDDGMIMNVEACRSFDPAPLVCESDGDSDCLAADRVDALGAMFAGAMDASGRDIYVPFPWDTGVTYRGAGLPGYLPAGAPGPFGPASAAREIDIDARLHDIRYDATGRLTDTAYWTNLSSFLDRDSKMIFFHGVSDPWFSAFDTWDYFQRAREANGAERWDNAARFFMVPGMMHCSGGSSFDQFDMLTPLVEWAEGGDAPESILARRSDGTPNEMPLCPHPSYAAYKQGDPAVATSYSCQMPEG